MTDLNRIREAHNGTRGPDQQLIAEIGLGIVDLLLRKNQDYGNSAWTAPLLAPGVSVREAIATRMSDKISRFAQLSASGKAEVAESLADTMQDLAGYAILWLGAECEENKRLWEEPPL